MAQSSKHRSPCPVVFALDLFGDRWTLLVIRDMVLKGSETYTEFLNSGEGIATAPEYEGGVGIVAVGNYVAIPGTHIKADGTDFEAIEQQKVSITPLSRDVTNHNVIADLADWNTRTPGFELP